MTELFLDVAVLRTDGVAGPGGAFRTFAQLGLAAGDRLELHARELTVESAPFGRDLLLVADTLIPKVPLHYTDTGFLTRVEVWAQHIAGALSISSRGRTGGPGAAGPRGTAAEWHWETITPDPSDGGPVVKPKREKVLDKPAGRGGRGGPGGLGGPGGTVRIRYATATAGPLAAATGGAGGPGGPGGPGGAGNGFPNGAPGAVGPAGPVGPAGQASVQAIPTADFWKAYAAQAGTTPARWADYRLTVAEYHFRRGDLPDLATARSHLALLVDRPGAGAAQARARKLTQRLWEGTTFLGLPRDLDVTPDVIFAAELNLPLFQTAQSLLIQAQGVANTAVLQGSFAQTARLSADQAKNSAVAAGDRIKVAEAHLGNAMTSTDIAQGRVAALDARIAEIQAEIKKLSEQPEPSFFEVVTKVVTIGAAIASVATGVGAGIGAAVAIGQGFATLSKTASDAKTLVDLVHDVKEKLKDPELKGFIKGFDDLGKAGKSIFHLGKIIGELESVAAGAPHPLLRELATAQRERVLVLKEVILHRQLEKEAQLGIDAGKSEQSAVSANAALADQLADRLEAGIATETDPVLRSLLASVRQLLDVLAAAMFRTQRAREIYLGKDLTEVVRYDLGHLHPDQDKLLSLPSRVAAIQNNVSNRSVDIVSWSSLVDSMDDAGALSQTSMPFTFSTDDPAHLEAFRTGRQLAFEIPVQDLFAEDGSQVYEAKFDGVTFVLHGATLGGATLGTVTLRKLGRSALRRRPDPRNPDGLVVEHTMRYKAVGLEARQLEKAVQAVLVPPSNPRSQPPSALWGRGIAGDWVLTDEKDLDLTGLTRVEVSFGTQALATSGAGRGGQRGGQRRLRPLLGWPNKPVPARGPTPIAARGWSTYGYGGGVAAVGAALI